MRFDFSCEYAIVKKNMRLPLSRRKESGFSLRLTSHCKGDPMEGMNNNYEPISRPIVAMIMGVFSLVFFFNPWIALIFGIIGLVFSLLAIQQTRLKQMGIAGLITSVLGLLIAVSMILFFILGAYCYGRSWNESVDHLFR